MEREILHVKTGAAAQHNNPLQSPLRAQSKRIKFQRAGTNEWKKLLKKMSLREQLFFSERHFLFNLWRSDHH
jgi:hypothetical protein